MPKLKRLEFYADAVRAEIRSWPDRAKKDLGDQMREIQAGGMPARAKRLPDVGKGAIQCKTNGYRTIVTVAIDDEVWIVHAFKKDAARGNKTRKHEMDLAKQRVEALLAKHATRH